MKKIYRKMLTKVKNQSKLYSSLAKAASLQPLTRTTTLANGLTVATESNPDIISSTINVFVNAGSRYENANNNGASHFLEHLNFKVNCFFYIGAFKTNIIIIGYKIKIP